jgi:DNA-binding MarR family transcriptional regulator
VPRRPERPASILLELYVLSQIGGTLLRSELEAAGVEVDSFGFVSTIAILEPPTPSQLAAELGLPLTTVSDSVQRLVDRGYVRREPNPADGRSILIHLTDRGRAMARDASPAVRAAQRRIAAELDRPIEDVRATLDDLRRAMRAAVEQQQDTPKP